MRPIFILALCLFTQTAAFAQTITVKSFEAIEAKSVKIEELANSVAVMLESPLPGVKTGAYVTVNSDFKWAVPSYDGLDFKETKTRGEWITFAKPGLYRILIGEFDPERGPRLTYHDLVINGTKPPIDPPTSDFASLTKAAKDVADRLNDPPTRTALAAAYRSAMASAAGKPYAEAQSIVRMARQTAFQANMRGNATVWNDWRIAIDAELVKVVPAGDVEKYLQAIAAIVKGLE